MMEGHAVNSAKPLDGQVFYLDTKSFKYTDQLEACLCELGGRVEKFLGKEVTRVISDRSLKKSSRVSAQQSPSLPAVLMSRGQRLLNKARHSAVEKTDSASSDLLTVAAQLNINIMPLRKILQLMKSFGCDVTKKENKSNQGRPVKLRRLQGPFVKFEHSSGRYKPCHMSFVSFPSLHFKRDTHSGSPFCAPIALRKPAENGNHKKVDTGQAPAGDGKKAVAGETLTKTGPENSCAPKAIEKKKPDKQTQSGYCECCDEWYKELKSHVAGSRHKSFASNATNYTSVDSLLNELPDIYNFLQGSVCEEKSIIDSVVDSGQADQCEIKWTEDVKEEILSKPAHTKEGSGEQIVSSRNDEVNFSEKDRNLSIAGDKSTECHNDSTWQTNGTCDNDICVPEESKQTSPSPLNINTVEAMKTHATSVQLSMNDCKLTVTSPVIVNNFECPSREQCVDQPMDSALPINSEQDTNKMVPVEAVVSLKAAEACEADHHIPAIDTAVLFTSDAPLSNSPITTRTAFEVIANEFPDPVQEMAPCPMSNLMPGYDSHSDIVSQMLLDVKDLSDNLGTELLVDDDYVRFVMCNQQTNSVLSTDLQGIVSELGMTSNLLFECDTRSNDSYTNNEYTAIGIGHVPVIDYVPNVINNAMTPGLDLGFSDSSVSDASFKPELHWEAIMKSLSEGPQGNERSAQIDINMAHDVSSGTGYDSEKQTRISGRRSAKENSSHSGKVSSGRPRNAKRDTKKSQGRKKKNSQDEATSSGLEIKSSDHKVNSSASDKLYNRLDNIIDQVCGSPVTRRSAGRTSNKPKDTCDNAAPSEVSDHSSNATEAVQILLTSEIHQQENVGHAENVSELSSTSFQGFKESDINNPSSATDMYAKTETGMSTESECNSSSVNDTYAKTKTGILAESECSSSSFYGFAKTELNFNQFNPKEQGSSEQTIMYGVEDIDNLEFYDVDIDTPTKNSSSQGTVMYDLDSNGDIDVESNGDTRESVDAEFMNTKNKEQSSSVSALKNKDMMAEWLGDDALMDNPYEVIMDTALQRSSDLCHTDISSSMRHSNNVDSLNSEGSSCSVKMKINVRKKQVLSVDFSDSESIASPCATPTRREQTRSLRQCDTSIKKTKSELIWQAVPSPSSHKLKISKVATPVDKRLVANWTVKHSGDCKLTFSVDRGLAKYKSKPKVSRRRLLYDEDS